MRAVLTVISIVLFVSDSFSATIYVPDDYPIIQDAINASVNGDTVIVRSGTYNENINFLGKAITVKSEQGAVATTIDGKLAANVVMFESGENTDSVLDGFTLTNGRAYGPYAKGGGVFCQNSSPTITNNVLSRNKAVFGGGGIFCQLSSANITTNIFSKNEGEAMGGGIYCDGGCMATITHNTFTSNTADEGGAIQCTRRSGPIVRYNLICGNTAFQRGGGINSYECASIIEFNTISGNTAENGGGISLYHASTPVISNNTIKKNIANLYGGGVWCEFYSSMNIMGNTIYGNTAGNCGGGVYCGRYSSLTSKCNTIIGNSAYNGGGVCFGDDSDLEFVNNLLAKNHALNDGGGLYIIISSQATVTNNTFTGNMAGNRGGGVLSHCQAFVTNSIVWNNNASSDQEIADLAGSSVVTFCDVRGGYLGTGNIDSAPRFIDPAVADFHLPYDSPCRNAGDGGAPALPAEDFEGDPRIFCGCVDMGADEFHPHLYHSGTAVPGGIVDIKLIAPPTVRACLLCGAGIEDPPQTTPYGDFHLSPPLLGKWTTKSMPMNGVRHISVSIPSAVPPGKVFPYQALVGPIATYPSLFTNLMVLEIE